MADYAIGDVQGCYDPLQKLLEKIQFDDRRDRLWFVGDLVSRGPDSLAVLRFLHQLAITPQITLGNHDLSLLFCLYCPDVAKQLAQEKKQAYPPETLKQVLDAEDAFMLGDWLRRQSIAIYDGDLRVLMCHAGIPPMWSFGQALGYARELEQVLSGPDYRDFLAKMYGNQPDQWSESLTGMDRLRLITNYFTRMRYFDRQGRLDFSFSGAVDAAPAHLTPWFLMPRKSTIPVDLIFGHWASLDGKCPNPHYYALDTGCVWGKQLTALCLQERQFYST